MSRKLSTEEFIKRAKNIHGNKYDYSLVEYKGCYVPIKIICSIHSIFEQSPNSHLKGSNCHECSKLKGGFSYNKKYATNNNFGVEGYLYIIKMFNYEEIFLKIGVTKNLDQRLNTIKFNSGYKIEILHTIKFDDLSKAILKENELHQIYNFKKYKPKKNFGGHTECFKFENVPINCLF